MKKVLLLIGVVLSLIFSTPYTLIGTIAIAASDEKVSEYSTAQQDLDNFGLIEDNYKLNPGSVEQVSCLLFAEVSNEKNYFYYLYLYDPKGFETINYQNYQSIQIGYLTSNEKGLLNNEEAISRTLNYYDITFLSKSDNGTVAKYIVNGLNPVDKKSQRRYQIRQLKYFEKSYSYIPLGDEYWYQTLADGSTVYEYKKINYITLNNVKAYSFLIENTEFVEALFKFLKNKDNLICNFYGFSIPDNYRISQLLEVDILYYYASYDYYSYDLNGDIYWGENPGLIGGDYYDKSPYFGKFSSTMSSSITIDTNHVSFEGQTIGMFFTKSFELEWDTITTPKEMENSTSNDYFKSFSKKFKDCDYVINYLNEEFTFSSFPATSHIQDTSYTKAVKLWAINRGSGYVYHIESNKVHSVEMTRMKFQSQGKIYNLAVITSPVTPIIDGLAKPNDSWFKKLWEKLCAWIEETFDTETPLTEIIAIIIIVLSVIVGIMLLVGIAKMILSGALKLLLDGLIAIITFPFNLFRSSKKANYNNFDNHNRR